jgi:hypothetical protein
MHATTMNSLQHAMSVLTTSNEPTGSNLRRGKIGDYVRNHVLGTVILVVKSHSAAGHRPRVAVTLAVLFADIIRRSNRWVKYSTNVL